MNNNNENVMVVNCERVTIYNRRLILIVTSLIYPLVPDLPKVNIEINWFLYELGVY